MTDNADKTLEEADTEGHMTRSGRNKPAEADAETEGHMTRSGRNKPAEAETEGHATRPGR